MHETAVNHNTKFC